MDSSEDMNGVYNKGHIVGKLYVLGSYKRKTGGRSEFSPSTGFLGFRELLWGHLKVSEQVINEKKS